MSDFRTLKGLYIKHVSSDPSNLVAGKFVTSDQVDPSYSSTSPLKPGLGDL